MIEPLLVFGEQLFDRLGKLGKIVLALSFVVSRRDHVGGIVFSLVEICVASWSGACERFVKAIEVEFLRCCDAVYSNGSIPEGDIVTKDVMIE